MEGQKGKPIAVSVRLSWRRRAAFGVFVDIESARRRASGIRCLRLDHLATLWIDRSATSVDLSVNFPLAVKMTDFTRQWAETGGDVSDAVSRVGQSGWYILGNEVQCFEAELAQYMERSWGIGCASGLDAIEIGLRALGLRAGDKVLTTPLSAFATSLAIVRAGGIPVFVDVDETGLVDLSLVQSCLESEPSIRFFVPVHLYGHSLDLDRLKIVKEKFGLRVVEDCAQAIGARHSGKYAGSIGEVGALSFYPTKNLGALGDAGAVLTDDDSLRDACRSLRDYGQTGKYEHSVLGLNSRLDEIHAAILRHAFLPRLGRWTERRRQVARAYLDGIRTDAVRPLPVPPGSESVWHLFPVLVNDGSRTDFLAHLRARGVQAAVHYPSLICDQKALDGVRFEIRGDLGRARRIAETEVSLPIHPYLEESEVERVLDAVNSWHALGSNSRL